MSETPATTNTLVPAEVSFLEIEDRNDPEYLYSLMELYKKMDKAETLAVFKKGQILTHCKKNRNYKALGSHIHKMEDLYNEYGIGYSMANHYMNVYRRYKDLAQKHTELLNLAIGKLIVMSPLPDEQIVDLLESAKTDPRKGFEDKVKVIKNKPPVMECNHADYPQELWQRCTNCGIWLLVEGK